MPIIDGKKVKARYTAFKMGELSAVDRPAQPGAIAHIRKRADSPAPKPAARAPGIIAMGVAKYVSADDGATSFSEVLQQNEFDQAVWPMTDALTQSIRSIMGDKSVKGDDRETQIGQTVQQFLDAVREVSPTTEKRLVALISKQKDCDMTLEEAKAEIADLKSKMKTMEPKAAKADTLQTELDAEKAAHADTKKALGEATEETIKVDGNDVKKSEVGAASFAVFKSLDDRARTAEVEKRVATEFPDVIGTTAEKAMVVKAAERFDEPTRKAFDTIMTAAQKTASAAFKSIGHGGGQGGRGSADAAASDTAVAKFKGHVAAIAKRDGITPTAATRKARAEHADDFAAAYPDQAERA